jgi:hypothetical protein
MRTILFMAAIMLDAAAQPARPVDAPIIDVFAPTFWQPPAPVQAPPQAAPQQAMPVAPPAAPPLPFRFLGRYRDGETQLAMLSNGDKLYLVASGDTIEGTYRVGRVSGAAIELTYLPLKQTQTLATGDAG